ncbi:hypothetical protein QBC40DRAFT_167527 [Triangularia verruculosa]|uniref:Uncharacterized protein n=1 Tax=Triangularia verruculosa TaxID=2587418 RepID=A0AAN6XM26_9PEZI|nr:hypothetical protein QBC40DRAFT_167527 [Triangularia verruculosa]
MDAERCAQNLETAKKGFLGLYVVHEPPLDGREEGEKVLDIVLVHGLNGHCVQTWTHPGISWSDWLKGIPQSVFWPTELLPERITNTRIMTYQYGSKALLNTSVATLSDTADDLMLRIQPDEPRQVFFGTPHRGSDAATSFIPVQKITGVVLGKSRFIPLLKTHSDGLREVSDEFRHVAARYALITFYEQDKHPILRKVIVDRVSAMMGMPHENIMVLGGDHSSMCKFLHNDSRFQAVWKAIQSAAKGVGSRRASSAVTDPKIS